MKAVTEASTGKALYLFEDATYVEITDNGMIGAVRALDIRPGTHSVVTTTQPDFWVGGGVLSWSGSAWVIEDQEAYDAAYAAQQPASPVAVPPQVTACALRVNVSGDEVTGFSGAYNIVAIIKMDVGSFWCLLGSEIAGAQPELVPNNGIHIGITEWYGTDFFIECRDHAGGTLIDPVSFGFTLYQFL